MVQSEFSFIATVVVLCRRYLKASCPFGTLLSLHNLLQPPAVFLQPPTVSCILLQPSGASCILLEIHAAFMQPFCSPLLPYWKIVKEYVLLQRLNSFCSLRRDFRVFAVASTANEAWNYIPAAPIFLPEGSWKQVRNFCSVLIIPSVAIWLFFKQSHRIPGGVTAAKGFNAAGMYGGLRAKGEKPDLALVTCDVDAISAGAFTTNVVAAAPVIYCKKALDFTPTSSHHHYLTSAITTVDQYRATIEAVRKLASSEILDLNWGTKSLGHYLDLDTVSHSTSPNHMDPSSIEALTKLICEGRIKIIAENKACLAEPCKFYTYAYYGEKSCKIVIDGSFPVNVISESVLKRGNLELEPHPQPYENLQPKAKDREPSLDTSSHVPPEPSSHELINVSHDFQEPTTDLPNVSNSTWITSAELQKIDPDLLEYYQGRASPHSTEPSSLHRAELMRTPGRTRVRNFIVGGVLEEGPSSVPARAVLINAGQANAATGDAGYQDVIESASALAKLLQLKPEEVLIESTGVIGQRIKKVNMGVYCDLVH
ncbi:arginine biosynthesis protein ArgJ family [Actinidia rufa]|uniref:Arginine biosynthesis protein ArgJ family n=1 Tax=Actinidia rufa TaxID=165716 RepID=A0A7J0FUC4_9ERIC|nr:arginine biosynthesis protein ArgJ family [Actinidia rufa]